MSLKELWCGLLGIELFLMMWATGELMAIKFLLLVIICALGVFSNNGRFRVSKKIVIWLCFYIGMNLFATILSYIYGNEGALIYLNVDIIEPIIFAVIVFIMSEADFHKLKFLPIYCLTFLSVYLIVAFLSINGLLPSQLVEIMPFVNSDFGGVLPFGLMKADAEFIQWMYFLIPANCVLFFFRDEIENPKLRRHIIINLILSVVAVVIILKTALLLVVGLSVIFAYFLQGYKKVKNKITMNKVIGFFIFFAIGIVAWSALDMGTFIYETLIKKILISFDVNTSFINSFGVADTGGSIRMTQIIDLIDTWKLKPVFGWGVGADALNVVRGSVPGTYEMTYFAKLMQRGLVGMMMYVVLIGWMYKGLLFAIKTNKLKLESLYILVGLTGILIANGTNPYLEAFDKLIILFLPLLVININSQKKSTS